MDSISQAGLGGREEESHKDPQKGVGTEGEKVGLKEQEQRQLLHKHTALSQGGCVHSLTYICNLFPPPRTLPSPWAPHPTPSHPTPPQLGSLSWASCSCDGSSASKPQLSGAENEREVQTRRTAPPRRAGNSSLRVPLRLPGCLLLLQYPYKGEAKSATRLAKKMYIFPRLDADFSPTARESTTPAPGQVLLFISHIKKTNPQNIAWFRLPSSWKPGSVFRGKEVGKGGPGTSDAPKLLERAGRGAWQPAWRCGLEL